MNKIKRFFLTASKRMQDVFKRFPVTVVLIIVITVFTYLQLQFDIMKEDDLMSMVGSLSIFAMGTLFVESFDKKKTIFTYVGFLIALIVAFIYYPMFKNEEMLEKNRYLLARLLVIYNLALGFGTIFILHKKSNLSFKQYALKVFSNLLKTSIYYGVFCLGTITIFIIFEVLIFSNGFDVYFNLLFLITGICYIPLLINCLVDLEETISGFLKGLITFVLFPIAIISTALIYVYFAKLIIFKTFLEDGIFYVIAWLFVSSFPVLILTNTINEKEESAKLNKIYCIAYIPFILIEIYSMSVRVSEYGLTNARYFAYIFVLMQAIIVGLLLYKNGEKLNYALIAMIIVAILCGVGPLSYINVGIRSQERRLAKALEGVTSLNDLSEEEADSVRSIARYLKENDDKEFVRSLISEEMEEELDSYYYWDSFYEDIESKYLDQDIDKIDISDYKRIYEVSRSYDDSDDVSKIKLQNNNISVEIDLTDVIDELIETDSRGDTSIILKTNDPKYDYYFKSISFSYDKETNKVKDFYSTYGFILERK